MLLILIVLAVIIGLLLLFHYVIRPWYLNWGASAEEGAMSIPGDELVSWPRAEYTRAITIHAPIAKVWPWLVQLGYQRAGWYNYDWLNRLLGAADFIDGHRSSNRIVPELQDLREGDEVCVAPGAPLEVKKLVAGQFLVLYVNSDFLETSWAYALQEPAPGTTRLIVRHKGSYEGFLIHFIFTFGSFIQERKHLLGIKKRAETL